MYVAYSDNIVVGITDNIKDVFTKHIFMLKQCFFTGVNTFNTYFCTEVKCLPGSGRQHERYVLIKHVLCLWISVSSLVWTQVWLTFSMTFCTVIRWLTRSGESVCWNAWISVTASRVLTLPVRDPPLVVVVEPLSFWASYWPYRPLKWMPGKEILAGEPSSAGT